MEEKSGVGSEENRDELLREMQELRQEINRLSDKLSYMEIAVYGRMSTQQTEYDRHPEGQPRYDRPQYEQYGGERPVYQKRASVVPELRRQRREKQGVSLFDQVGEMDVGKYGTAFLAAVCILAGCGILMVSAWALAGELTQAMLMFALGIVMTGGGWVLHQKNGSSAVAPTLAACGLGILYMDCIALHFLWDLVPVEGVLAGILIWAVVSFYMAFTGETLLFYYVINLGNLATAVLTSSLRDGAVETWAGLVFTVAAYGVTLFQVFRIGVGRKDRDEKKVRRLKNTVAVNILAAYAILFLGKTENLLLLFTALLTGGMILFFWHDLYQGGAREEGAGVLVLECQMAVYCYRLAETMGRQEGIVVYAVTLLLLLTPMLRARNREMMSAWILWPALWVSAELSRVLTGEVYPVPYLLLTVYYGYMLLFPAACKIYVFVPAYIGMYFILMIETWLPAVSITFGLMIVYALGIPVKYLIKTEIGNSQEGGETAILSSRQIFRYGAAMTAAFVVCVTYCSLIEKPALVALETAMLTVFTGVTLWMESRDPRFFSILSWGEILLWLMSWEILELCEGGGSGLELASGISFMLAGSLAAWCGVRCREKQRLNNELGKINGLGGVFCLVSLMMFIVSLYRFILIFQIPYAVFVSLILLFVAVFLLMLGFWLSNRQIRAYALFLMALCVAKMVTVDLSGTGWVYRAGALAGGGVLCMIVSFIYSRREKKQDDEEQP